jgi:AmmeMemoRadiSam system protein B
MSERLPRLRLNLEFMSSPVADRPGLLIRDPYQYSDATLIIPPPLVESLRHFDGESTDLDLRETLARITGDLSVGDLVRHLTGTLSAAGFLEDDAYLLLRQNKRREFADAPVRAAAHAGSAYPGQTEPLRALLNERLGTINARQDGLAGIAAPHVSPEGGWESYAAAYRSLGAHYADRVFVVLGTSHYGEPDRFGLTRKSFATPIGEARTETTLVDWLAARAGDAVEMEDYCHSTEHSIEFQVVFLMHLFGPDVRILPILCGPYAKGLFGDGLPEEDENVRRFLDVLGELNARERGRLLWVLGVDMAHMGRRYGDPFTAQSGAGIMQEVEERDRERIGRIAEADAAGFWELVKRNRDDLKWCGSAPFYTFLRAAPGVRGSLLAYQQWNIDEQSVVSFAGMAFRES